MYIGPWQEFKLARILQIKEKLDKEAEEDNRIPEYNDNVQPQQQKAYSVGGNMMPSTLKADSRINTRKQHVSIENKYKYRMDPQFAPPHKQVPLLKSTYSEPVGNGASRVSK